MVIDKYFKIVCCDFLGIRGGYSVEDSAPGVIFAHGKTWKDLRAITMHYMKDLGMGKPAFTELIDQNADFLMEYIDENHANKPVLVGPLFFRTTVALVWSLIAN